MKEIATKGNVMAAKPVLDALLEGLPLDMREALDQMRELLIYRALENNGGRRAASARELGLTREGLYKLSLRLGMIERTIASRHWKPGSDQ